MDIAYAVTEHSTCDRAFADSVLVLDKRILTTSFNGSSAGQPHFDEIGPFLVDGHDVLTIQAETYAIIPAALHTVVHTQLLLLCRTIFFASAAPRHTSTRVLFPS